MDSAEVSGTAEGVAAWSREALTSAVKGVAAGVHVDELDPAASPDTWLDVGIRNFAALTDLVVDRRVRTLFVAPLRVSKSLVTRPAAWEEYAPIEEPPSLYLVSVETLASPEDSEEYRVPVELPGPLAGRQDMAAYYRCSRDRVAISHGWEYQRALYVLGGL